MNTLGSQASDHRSADRETGGKTGAEFKRESNRMLWVRTLLGERLARPRRLVPLLAALALFMPLTRVAWAEPVLVSFSVNTKADGHAANPAGGVCETAPGNGQCSLRAALEVTNNLAAGDAVTISVPAGHYVLSLGSSTWRRSPNPPA